MKIAVILYGQPRFFDKTWKFLKEEFKYDEVEFDFFIHFWKEVSFSPRGEVDDLITEDVSKNTERIINKLNTKDYVLDDYIVLDNFLTYFQNTHEFLTSKQFKNMTLYNSKHRDDRKTRLRRYQWGQHVSVQRAFNLLRQYEQKNNFKYDVVIKHRPDFVFKNAVCYNNIDSYNKEKWNHYFNFNSFDVPECRTPGNNIQYFDTNLQQWRNKKCIPRFLHKKYPSDWVREKHTLFRTADVSMATNRLAADCYYLNYFHTYLNTLTQEHIWGISSEERVTNRFDGMQGEVAIQNNIYVENMKCRYYRIVRESDAKEGWKNVAKNKTILFNNKEDESEEGIQKQLLIASNKWKEGSPAW